jgi:hypothetical protein
MTASPWAPSNAGGAIAPHITPPTAPHIPPHAGPGGPPSAAPPPPYLPAPPPPRGAGPRLWPIIAAFSVLVAAAIAITAVITAAIVKTSPQPAAPPPAPSTPQYSAAEQASAKQNVCQAFDAGERGSTGAVVISGDLNLPTVLRMVNAHVAVDNALSPAAPTDVSDAAHKYLTTSTDLTTAALANKPVDMLNDLTKTNNSAIDSFAGVCGLPH